MEIRRIQCGTGQVHLVKEDDSAIIIDTGTSMYLNKVISACKEENIKLIVLTHGHIDHIENAARLSRELNVPIAMHERDLHLLESNLNEPMYADSFLGKIVLASINGSFKHSKIDQFIPAVLLKEGDTLDAYGVSAEVVELPGHTLGSIGLKMGDTDLFVGDALMNLVYPCKSMLYGDKDMVDSSASKISDMGEATIHFGHGKPIPNKTW